MSVGDLAPVVAPPPFPLSPTGGEAVEGGGVGLLD